MNRIKAYNEMVELLLSSGDREKFEWVIGALLSDASPNITVVRGGPQSGKTTLMMIVRKITQSATADFIPRVVMAHDGYIRDLPEDAFVFVEQNDIQPIDGPHVIIHTTGDSVPVNKHYVLMETINSEVDAIAEHCIQLYQNLGDNYFEEIRENN